jgi:hypothetical protein
LQSDPAGQSGGVNLYAYPANPLVAVDVLGLTHTQQEWETFIGNHPITEDTKDARTYVEEYWNQLEGGTFNFDLADFEAEVAALKPAFDTAKKTFDDARLVAAQHEIFAHSFANKSIADAQKHFNNESRFHKSDATDLIAALTVDALTSESEENAVMRHDFQNKHAYNKGGQDFANYQVQIGGSNFRFGGKANTSVTNVVVDRRLLVDTAQDHNVLLEALKEGHQQSMKHGTTVLLTYDDEHGHEWIQARLPKANAQASTSGTAGSSSNPSGSSSKSARGKRR